MKNRCHNTNPLKHSGSSQGERLLESLIPDNVELHGLTEEEWLKFAYDYAQLINFYNSDHPDQPKGDWQAFFESSDDITVLLDRYGDGDVDPHLALFISFLKLLVFPQKSLNGIPKRHLDFYYSEVLQLNKKPFEPDHVHLLFELAKNAKEELVDQDVSLKAGKDSKGNPLHYRTLNSLVVNPANVHSLKSVFVDEKEDGNDILRIASMSNSVDGIEEELDEGESWLAFGNPVWPTADLGFYVASNLLLMGEGRRIIQCKMDLSTIPDINESNIQVFLTSEKEWMKVGVSDVRKSGSDYNFIVQIEVTDDLDPVVGYNEEVHQEGIHTTDPVLKVQFVKPADEPGEWEPLDYFTLNQSDIQKFQLEVTAELSESLKLQNELGNVDPSKPFMPFGSRPKVGSKLEIISDEMKNKPISNIKIDMAWLNVPSNFSEHYKHYLDEIRKQKQYYISNISNQGTYNVINWYKDAATFHNEYNLLPIIELNGDGSETSEPVDDTMKENFKVQVDSPYYSESKGFEMFKDLPQIEIDPSSGPIISSKGDIDLILAESFYHDLYAELYVNTIIGQDSPVDLPNEPYTPLLDQLTLTYTARQEISFSVSDVSENRSLMFHRHPFGIKQVFDDEKALVPDYKNSELYIGIENLTPGSNISLLFQVAEGSENPNHSSFEEGDIDWWVLSDNEWLKVENSDFARNQTNHFLRSGIVELPVSKEATDNNTLLSSGLHWLRVRLKKKPDAVSRFINVHAQAGEAVFFNQENSTDHLENGLPADTISQLVNPRAQIKSVSQPYASFGGSKAESDDSFYRRISERLRHKDRAVSIWDYEHLVLEEFPSLYKVKCLNHTKWDGSTLNELSPGDVTLVLIPKITEGNTEFRLKPMVSQDFRDQVEAFVNGKNSMHATVKAANAVYETVRFEFNIRFHTGLDFNYYKGETSEDLKRLLAPWVFETDAAIEFDGSFSEYQIVNYLEKLEYVDFITDFSMFHKPLNGDFTRKTIIEPSNPMAILVPVENHQINQADRC